jgi:phage I-like protein
MSAAKHFGIKHEGAMPKPKIHQASEGYKRASAVSPPSSSHISNDGGGDSRIATFAVAIEAEEAPEWVELIPAGKFSAVDGRGPFENQDPQAIVAASIAKMPQVGLVLDFDHSTDLAAPEGRPAPAAGWLKEFKVQHGAIFARIEWTQDAAEAVKEKKYRYVSPVFEHDKQGRVERILRAALTNNPALINLPALAQAIAQRKSFAPFGMTEGGVVEVQTMARKDGEKPKLSEVMAALEEAYPDASPEKLMEAAACLIADDDGDEGDDGEEDEHMEKADGDPYESETAEQMAARHIDEMAKCASEEERESMARKHALEEERFARRIKGLEVTEEKRMSQVVARHPMVLRMAHDLNQLRAAQAQKTAETAVDAAIRDGRLIPSQRTWAIEYCSADPKGFTKFIGAQLKIIQNGADGTFSGRIGEPPRGVTSLSQREIEIFANLGLETKEQLEKCAAVKEKWELRFPRPRLMLDDSNSGQGQPKE